MDNLVNSKITTVFSLASERAEISIQWECN